MEPTELFSSKAQKYSRFRWDYAPKLVQRIFEVTRLNNQSISADIGAGTWILTRHFVGCCGLVYAIEPNGPMRVLDGRAEASGLADQSLDLITVAQALSWFDPLH